MAVHVNNPKISYRTADGWLDALTGELSVIRFPTVDTVGINAIPGWTPTTTITDENLRITGAGTVIEDVLVTNGSILAFAPNVTIRRCKVINGGIYNYDAPAINNGMLVEDCTIQMIPPANVIPLNVCVSMAGFTLRRVAIIDVMEGIQIGGTAGPLTDPTHPDGYAVRLYDCFFRGQVPFPESGDPTEPCYGYHGDLMQPLDFGGTGGTEFIVRNCTVWSNERNPYCGFSSLFDAYYGHCRPVDIDGLMMSGGAGCYRGGAGGSVKNMFLHQDSWNFYPVAITDEAWERYTYWDCVTFDELDEDGQPLNILARVPYTWPYGPLAPVEPWEPPGLDTFGWEG